MVFWFMLWVSIFFSLFLYSYPGLNKDGRNLFTITIASTLTYFSAFRFGLGQDYEGYTDVIQQNTRTYSVIEPAYTFLVKFVNNNGFTEVFFFLIFSIITNFLIIYGFRRFKNFQLMVIVYISFPILYFNSFNLVRQFCALSIIFSGFYFLEKRYFFKYTTSVMIAALFHASALLCIPIYFLWKIKIPKFWMVFLAVLTLIFGAFSNDQLGSLFRSLSSMFNIYSIYIDDETSYEPFGLLTIYFNLLLFWVIYNTKSSEMKPIDNFILVGFFLLTLIYNLIPSFFYLQRLSLYFIIFFPLVLSIPTYRYNILKYFIIISSSIFFLYFIISNSSNVKVIPISMKTINDLIG